MHVFIDTNILLSFYHSSKDQLDELHKVFATHRGGSATVYLTQQVCDEFKRNRDSKINDALKLFNRGKLSIILPVFMRKYQEHSEIIKLRNELEGKSKSILEKAHNDISSHELLADILIGAIFKAFPAIKTTEEILNDASSRMAVGNPPGKKRSIGDAVNWILLLNSVPDNQDIHIISEDGDFYSSLYPDEPHSFLAQEWREEKNGELKVYKTLLKFMTEYFDGTAFYFDKNKETLLEDLENTGTYATTHEIIVNLEGFEYFSLSEVERILSAATQNSQFGSIVTDEDIVKFLNRVAVPRMSDIKDPKHKYILKKVAEGQQEMDDAIDIEF